MPRRSMLPIPGRLRMTRPATTPPRRRILAMGDCRNGLSSTGSWTLDYTLTAGLLDFVQNNATSGTTGLLGLTGVVDGDNVELFATNYTIGDTDQTYLYGIDDDTGRYTGEPGRRRRPSASSLQRQRTRLSRASLSRRRRHRCLLRCHFSQVASAWWASCHVAENTRLPISLPNRQRHKSNDKAPALLPGLFSCAKASRNIC